MLRKSPVLAFVLIFCVLPMVRIASAQDRLWRPYIELEGRGTSIRQLGQGNLFLPLMQDCDSLLFADLRGLWTDGDAAEGNWGLAYRKIMPSGWITGAHLFYDLRHTEQNNNFHQGTAGVELLNINWGFRANGYIPDQDVKAAPGLNGAFLQGNNIVVRPGLEAAYWGVDFEVERLIWCRDGNPCDCGPWWSLSHLDTELWAAAGVFHFDNDVDGFESITGPRVRAELRLYDLPMIGNDSRVVLSGQYEHDDVRGSVGSGMLTVRIPFGPGGGRRSHTLSPLDRRMVTPIVRDIDIVANAAAVGPVEAAKFARTGLAISSVRVVDANDDLSAEVTAAGADSVVIVDGSAGVINEADTSVLNTGQVVVGGGAKLDVIGCSSGARAQFCAPGIRPTVNGTSTSDDIFTIANDAAIIGLDITGGEDGINGSGVSGFLIANNVISGAVEAGVELTGTNSGTISGNTASDNGREGFFINQMSGGTINDNLASGNSFRGFAINTLNGSTFSGNTARGNTLFGFLLSTLNGGSTVRGNTASGNIGDGFFISSMTGGSTVSDNSSIGNTDRGFAIGSLNVGTVTDNTATNNMSHGIAMRTFLSGTVSGNRASDNTFNGFDVENYRGGTLSANTSGGNGGDGYFITSFSGGTVSDNTATGNTDDGFDINSFSLTAQFNNNVANDNTDAGYEVGGAGGTATGNTGSGNGSNDIFP